MLDRAKVSLVTAAVLMAALAVAGPGCGSSGNGATFSSGGTSGDDGGGSSGEPPILGGDGGSSGTGEAAPPCVGLCLKQKACAGGATTSLSGSVYDPAGKVPLYNVVVYVPNAPVDPIASGATCDKCGAVSGSPLVTTLTDATGHFKLDNVPIDKNLPLVVQVGKWRRQVTLPIDIQECKDNPLTTPALQDLTRLPKNQGEGNIPLIALTTGGADALECFLRKVGVEDKEFSVGGGAGRVQFYSGFEGTTKFQNGASFTDAKSFWSSLDNLKKYDIVLLSCEGATDIDSKPQPALDAMGKYADLGGRVFASHWHRFWFDAIDNNDSSKVETSPFTNLGTWKDAADLNDITADVNTGFAKGKAMADWLTAVEPKAQNGKLPISGARNNLSSVTSSATSWISYAAAPAIEYMSFNTPQAADDDHKCGKVVYSDLHVSSGVGDEHTKDWPTGCKTTTLSPQEKALEFMLFDLSSCIQNDNVPPVPPPPVVK